MSFINVVGKGVRSSILIGRNGADPDQITDELVHRWKWLKLELTVDRPLLGSLKASVRWRSYVSSNSANVLMPLMLSQRIFLHICLCFLLFVPHIPPKAYANICFQSPSNFDCMDVEPKDWVAEHDSIKVQNCCVWSLNVLPLLDSIFPSFFSSGAGSTLLANSPPSTTNPTALGLATRTTKQPWLKWVGCWMFVHQTYVARVEIPVAEGYKSHWLGLCDSMISCAVMGLQSRLRNSMASCTVMGLQGRLHDCMAPQVTG